MKCLAKDADDRPQRAVEIVRILETVTSGAGHDAMPMILAGGRGMFKRAMLVYVLAFVIVAVVAKAAIVAVGLPDWVFPGALVVMALGLPVILFTAYVHRTTRRILGATPTYTPGGTPSLAKGTMAQMAIKASPHVSWRRAAIGGGAAVAGFVLLVGVYMVLRAFGIGPAGSLLAAGAIAQDEKILVADLTSPANDSTLGPVVTDAFRTALGQSQSVAVVQPATVRDVLRRMERPADSKVDFALAREIATREGIKAVIDGSLLGVGGKYVIAMRLVSAQTGEPLATFRQTANDQSEILPTVDRLAKEVRAKIGESLKNVQSTTPLEQVTTPSLEALRKYVDGLRIMYEGDFARGEAMLQEAVAIDTGFAMAYRKLAVEYSNRSLIEKSQLYYDKAYAHIDRLSDAERYLLLGSYYSYGRHADAAKATAAFERLLEIQPKNTAGLNNLSSMLMFAHQPARAESLLAEAIRVGPVASVHYYNLMRARLQTRKVDSARAAIDQCAKAFPKNVDCLVMRANLQTSLGQFDSVRATAAAMEPRMTTPDARADYAFATADFARLEGRLADADRLEHEGAVNARQAGITNPELLESVNLAYDEAWFRGNATGAVRRLDELYARTPLRTVRMSEAPYLETVLAYAAADRPDRARTFMEEWNTRRKESPTTRDTVTIHRMRGAIALASKDYTTAQSELRFTETQGCLVCDLPRLGRSFDLAGAPDSAIAVYERYLTTLWPDRLELDARFLPAVEQRLGELYEAKGQREKALAHYRRFIDLWKNADPALQPRVTDAKLRVAALTKGTDVRR
jgi:tetratricopeptide (TPR) repeat protein